MLTKKLLPEGTLGQSEVPFFFWVNFQVKLAENKTRLVTSNFVDIMSSNGGDRTRFDQLLKRIAAAEKKTSELEEKLNDPVERVKRELIQKRIYTAKFHTVHDAYYDLSLEERAALLQCQVQQLCKSIVFENKAHDPTVCDKLSNSKYYCVITQYTGTVRLQYFVQQHHNVFVYLIDLTIELNCSFVL